MIRRPITLSVRVDEVEFQGLMSLCQKWNVTRQDVLRALIIDALVDEGVDVLRRWESKRCSNGTKAGKDCGAAT